MFEYVQETINDPSELGSVKETEEEYASKEGKKVYSLHDLSRDLKKLSCRSDLFEGRGLSLGPITPVVQGEEDINIKESESEYDASSEDEKRSNHSTPFCHDSKRTMFIDQLEPYEDQIKKAVLPPRPHKLEVLPDTIQEENSDTELLGENSLGIATFEL